HKERAMTIGKVKQALAAYAIAVLLSLVFIAVNVKLWKADLRIPFQYTDDALVVDGLVKGIIDNGWYTENKYLGAPSAMEFYDYPMADNLHMLTIKLLGLIYPDHAVTFNCFFLLGFPLITVTTLFVFR